MEKKSQTDWLFGNIVDLLQYYQTVNYQAVSQYPNTEQEQILSSAFRTDRKDILFEQKTIEKHFNENTKYKTVLLRTNSF